jgi:hypothetical protein
MIDIYSVVWRVIPLTPPRLRRYCSSCGDSQLFSSSGKIRLNANGRKLDAWLIYKCSSCEKTWKLRVVERATVTSIAEADLQALHRSDPDWVRGLEYDLAMLKGQCEQIDFCPDLSVKKTFASHRLQAWSAIDLMIDAPYPTGQRLDRFLANELRLSRSALQSMHRAGGLQCDLDRVGDLKKPVSGCFVIRIVAAKLTESLRQSICDKIIE